MKLGIIVAAINVGLLVLYYSMFAYDKCLKCKDTHRGSNAGCGLKTGGLEKEGLVLSISYVQLTR